MLTQLFFNFMKNFKIFGFIDDKTQNLHLSVRIDSTGAQKNVEKKKW